MIFARLDLISLAIIILILVFLFLVIHAVRYWRLLRALVTIKSRFLLVGFHRGKKIIKYCCFFIAIVSLLVALLRPQVEKEPLAVQEEGWNIVFALDVSRSMRAADIEPSRLTAAKEKIKAIVSQLSCARLSLVLFSQDAFVQCPMTSDKDAFFLFLDHVDSETISGGSTALDRALSVSLDAMKEVSNSSKIIILLTDGEDFSDNLSAVKKQLKEKHIVLCALGIGTPTGAPIPIIDQTGLIIGYEKDHSGTVAISRLNERVLSDLTKDLGGLYTAISSYDQDIKKIHHYVTMQKKGLMGEQFITRKTDLYPYFIGCGILFLLLEWFL